MINMAKKDLKAEDHPQVQVDFQDSAGDFLEAVIQDPFIFHHPIQMTFSRNSFQIWEGHLVCQWMMICHSGWEEEVEAEEAWVVECLEDLVECRELHLPNL